MSKLSKAPVPEKVALEMVEPEMVAPEIVPPVIVGVVKVPPFARAESVTERLSASESDCLVTVGLTSSLMICSLSMIGLITGPAW